MTLAEMIYEHSQRLPEPAAREALDFIEFLEQRYGVALNGGEKELTPVQREALERLSIIRVPFGGGKPILSRDSFYDDVRA